MPSRAMRICSVRADFPAASSPGEGCAPLKSSRSRCAAPVSAGRRAEPKTGRQSRCMSNSTCWAGSMRYGEATGAASGSPAPVGPAGPGDPLAPGKASHSCTQDWRAAAGPCTRTWTRQARQRPPRRGTSAWPQRWHVPGSQLPEASQCWHAWHRRRVPHAPQVWQLRGPGPARCRMPRGPGTGQPWLARQGDGCLLADDGGRRGASDSTRVLESGTSNAAPGCPADP